MLRPQQTVTLFPYTTLFRSGNATGSASDDAPGDRRVDATCEARTRSEEHTSELQSHVNLVCRLLLEKKKRKSRSPARSRSARVWPRTPPYTDAPDAPRRRRS